MDGAQCHEWIETASIGIRYYQWIRHGHSMAELNVHEVFNTFRRLCFIAWHFHRRLVEEEYNKSNRQLNLFGRRFKSQSHVWYPVMIHVFGRRSKISRCQRRVGKRETGQCSSRFYMTSTEFLRVRPSRRYNPVTSNLMSQWAFYESMTFTTQQVALICVCIVRRVNDVRNHCGVCGELRHEDTRADEKRKSNDVTTIFSVCRFLKNYLLYTSMYIECFLIFLIRVIEITKDGRMRRNELPRSLSFSSLIIPPFNGHRVQFRWPACHLFQSMDRANYKHTIE